MAPEVKEIVQDAETQLDATPDEQDADAALDSSKATSSDGGAQSADAADSDSLTDAQVPPELEETKKNLLRDYHAKMAEFAIAQKDSTTLQKLFQQEWFKRAMDAEKSKKSGAALAFELTDDQFEAAKSDKRAFLELAKQVAETVVASRVDDKIASLHETTESLRFEREFDQMASRYGEEFRQFNDDGKLEPHLNQGCDYETAYAKAKLAETKTNGADGGAVTKKAEEILRARKQQAVEKGGVSKASGSKIIKAKTWSQAVSRSLDALLAGEKDFKLSRE